MGLATVPAQTDPRELALLKAVGLDRLSVEQRELALNIASRYELDLLLKHLVMIEGRPYITRDGLLHVAHRSGQLDGIETTDPVIVDDFWRSTCSVYRKDMSRPFTYTGRYPTKGGNQKFAPEMATKVGEVMALRRAFDVAAPTLEERWDIDIPPEPTEKPKAATLAEKVASKAEAVQTSEDPTVPATTKNGSPTRATTPPDTSTGDESIDLQAAAEAIFREDEPHCGWRVETKAGMVDCTLGEMHEGDHSWHEIAVKQGGKVLRPPE